MDKLHQLQQQYEVHGPFRISKYPGRWIPYAEATPWQKQASNLRELCQDEVVLDIESKENVKKIISKLKRMQLNFLAYDTGSRGIHIHLYFEQLMINDWSMDKIRKCREWFIRKFDADFAKKSGVVAIENWPHFKTGRRKTLISKHYAGVNILPKQCLKYLNHSASRKSIKITSGCIIPKCKLINLAMFHKLKSGSGRGDVLFRNAAIFLNQHYDVKESLEYLGRLQSVQRTGSVSWLDWVMANKKNNFSCGELRRWLRNTGQENMEQVTCWRCDWK